MSTYLTTNNTASTAWPSHTFPKLDLSCYDEYIRAVSCPIDRLPNRNIAAGSLVTAVDDVGRFEAIMVASQKRSGNYEADLECEFKSRAKPVLVLRLWELQANNFPINVDTHTPVQPTIWQQPAHHGTHCACPQCMGMNPIWMGNSNTYTISTSHNTYTSPYWNSTSVVTFPAMPYYADEANGISYTPPAPYRMLDVLLDSRIVMVSEHDVFDILR